MEATSTEPSPVVDLDALKPKQRLKEFKTVQRELKGKDLGVKCAAILKLRDERYLSEGGCLPPLLLSLVPKKKMLEDTTQVLERFASYLQQQYQQNNDFQGIAKALTCVIDEKQVTVAQVMQPLLDILNYQEEVKKTKAKAQNDDAAAANQSLAVQMINNMKSLAVKVIYYMVMPMIQPCSNDFISVKKALGEVKDFINTVSLYLSQSYNAFLGAEAGANQAARLQDCSYASRILTFLLQHNHNAPSILMQHLLCNSLLDMVRQPHLRVHALQCLHIAVTHDDCLDLLSYQDNQSILIEVAEEALKKLIELTVVTDVPPAKGKNASTPKSTSARTGGKAKDPPEVAPEDPFRHLDAVPIQDVRKAILIVSLVNRLYIALAEKRKGSLNVAMIARVINVVEGFMINEAVWDVVCQPQMQPIDISLLYALHEMCILLGRLAEVGADARSVLRANGSPVLLLKFFQSSSKAFNSAELDPKIVGHWRQLGEKALLAIVVEPRESDSDGGDPSSRWSQCVPFILTKDLFEALTPHFVPLLTSLLDANDRDVAQRMCRLLCSMLCSAETDARAAIASDKALVAKLAQFLSTAVSIALNQPEDTEELTEEVLDVVLSQAFYYILSCLEIMLPLNAENVKLVATKDRLLLLSGLLVRYGPLCGSSISRAKQECAVKLYEPRSFLWTLEAKEEAIIFEERLLRPLLLDVLTCICSQEVQLRRYEASLPIEPLQPFPKPIESVLEEAALITISTSINACCRLLLLSSSWSIDRGSDGGQDLIALQPKASPLPTEEVLNAALRFLAATAAGGPYSIMAGIEGIANKTFQCDQWLVDSCLSEFITLVGHEHEQFNPSALSWTRPVYFTDLRIAEAVSICGLPGLSTSTALWPFFATAGALMGLLGDVRLSPASIALALHAVQALSKVFQYHDHSQPLVADAFSAVFLALGGGIAIAGALGRFGPADCETKKQYVPLLEYLLSRGSYREQFWRQWLQQHREEPQIDPKTGKIIPKKEEKKKEPAKPERKLDSKMQIAVPVVIEIAFPSESTEQYADPNRGPSRQLWKELLDRHFVDHRLHSPRTTALIAMIQSQLSSLTDTLLGCGVDVNSTDHHGRCALSYAALLSDDVSTKALLACPATDVNLVDGDGVPVLHNCFYALTPLQIDQLLPGPAAEPVEKKVCAHGEPVFVPDFLSAGKLVHINAHDANGYTALHLAAGLGFLEVRIGGYPLLLRPCGYHDEERLPRPQICRLIDCLLVHEAQVDLSCRAGVTLWHIAAARGDLQLLQLLHRHHAAPGLLDGERRHALHYLCACAPSQAIECFDFILEKSSFRPVLAAAFEESKDAGGSTSARQLAELSRHWMQAVENALQPTAFAAKRSNSAELFALLAHQQQLSPLFMICVAEDMFFSPEPVEYPSPAQMMQEMVAMDKLRRLELMVHVLRSAQRLRCLSTACAYRSVDDLTIFHALAILCRGRTPQLPLTEKQRRQVNPHKIYASKEQEALDIITQALPLAQIVELLSVRSQFTMQSVKRGLEQHESGDFMRSVHRDWLAVHGAILADNLSYVEQLLSLSPELYDASLPVHWMCNVPAAITLISEDMADFLIARCPHEELLNQSPAGFPSSCAPLTAAVLNDQVHVVQRLLRCKKLRLNAVEESTGMTAFALACCRDNLRVMRAFAAAKDRLDLAVPCVSLSQVWHGETGTCVDVALHQRRKDLLQVMAELRALDVVEQLVNVRAPGVSWLMHLEQENEQLIRMLTEGEDAQGNNQEPDLLSSEEQKQSWECATDAAVKVIVGAPEDDDEDGLALAADDHDLPMNDNEPRNDEAVLRGDQSSDAQTGRDFVEDDSERRSALRNELRNSNDLLEFVLKLVFENGVVGSDHHVHPRYESITLHLV